MYPNREMHCQPICKLKSIFGGAANGSGKKNGGGEDNGNGKNNGNGWSTLP